MNDRLQEYHQCKKDFLDSLQPDDFRNGSSFNQAEEVIDQINQSLAKKSGHQDDKRDAVYKAMSHLFREGSPAIERAVHLSHLYFQSLDAMCE